MSDPAMVKRSRERRNQAERAFVEAAEAHGWKVTKRGYPDFICFLPDGPPILVEVKQHAGRRLSKAQWRFKQAFRGRPVQVYKWTPDKDWVTDKSKRVDAK
jgi:hypothetical protein